MNPPYNVVQNTDPELEPTHYSATKGQHRLQCGLCPLRPRAEGRDGATHQAAMLWVSFHLRLSVFSALGFTGYFGLVN